MEFRVLGTVELWSANNEYNLGSIKVCCVLTILVLDLGTVVPVEVLIDRVWDSDPPPKARETLSTYITRLRKLLRQAVGDHVSLTSRAHGYVLDGDPEDVDLFRFRRLRQQAGALAGSGDREHAVELLREADMLWRGEALTGLDGYAMARLRRSLEEERRAAILERINLEFSLGRHADMLADLQRLSDKFYLDEVIVAHQMTALYLCGRPGDALGVYRETRARMVGELGVEPGEVLSEMHQRILHKDPDLQMMPLLRQPGQPSAPNTLPAAVDEFVGREREMLLLTERHNDSLSTVVITGMPGVGKTVFAIEAARRVQDEFPDGQLFVSFCTHDPRNSPLDASAILHRLLRMLGVAAEHIPHSLADRMALWRAQLVQRRMVIVLDDVADSDQVHPLLPTAGKHRVLITARSRIHGLDQARPLDLDVLPPEDAAELFIRIAESARPGDRAKIAEIVRLCGQLPLAIQLAARSARQGGLAELTDLVDELSNPARDLADATLASPEVATAFELSYRALPDGCQRLFRRLGLHPGNDITMHTAAALGGGTLAETEAGLAALLEHHLLERTDQTFHFHDLIRKFAGACAMRDDPEPTRRLALGRLLDYYRCAAERANKLLYPHSRRPTPATHKVTVTLEMDTRERAADWTELEWRNILYAAQSAGEHEWKAQCANLTFLLAEFLEAGGHWSEAANAHTIALRACRDLDDRPGIARAELELSIVAANTGDQQKALSFAEDAAAIYHAVTDQRGEAEALDQIGIIHRNSAQFREALGYHQEADVLYHAAADWQGVASTLNHAGIACWHLGRHSDASDHLRSALALYSQAGDRRGAAKILNNLGKMQQHQGYHREALQNYRDALDIFAEIGGEQSKAILHQNIGCIYQYKENYEDALVAYRRALAIYRRIGDLPGVAAVLIDIGISYYSIGHFGDALNHLQRAEEMAGELDDSFARVAALSGIADAYRSQGRYEEALEYYQNALRLAREISEPYREGKILDGIAETMLRTKGPGAARIYWHQALDVWGQLGVPEAETVRIRLDTLLPEQERHSS